ncbi:MAG: hypothetical protein ABW148_00590 [Sedimenticola sp.]
MNFGIRRRIRRLCLCAFPLYGLAMFCCLLPFNLSAAEEDDYLSEINMEGEKVGKRTGQSQPSRDSGSTVAREAGLGFTSGMSMEEFSVYLKEKYTGSGVFYKKLEPRSQEEIYEVYLGGAPYAEVRKRIMDRFLKRR